MNRRTIASSAIAAELLDRLQKQTGRALLVWSDIDNSFTARHCTSRSLPTGGCIIKVAVPRGFVVRSTTYTRHLRPGWTAEQFETAVGNLYHKAIQERNRQSMLAILDNLAKPLLGTAGFIEAVEQRESEVGLSDYGTMSVEQITDWTNWLRKWDTQKEYSNGKAE